MEALFVDAKVSTNSCGTPKRPSILVSKMVPIWVQELGSEFGFAVGHVCKRKVALHVSLGVVAAPVQRTSVASLSQLFHGHCVS